jgi:NAD-dependent deacetylase
MDAIITQNVDNLHQEAGSNHVIEYHGNARKLVCMKCRRRRDIDRENPGQYAPRCRLCNGLMKPDVVMFGEMIPKHALYEAEVRAQQCDVMIVVGTSAQVFPAAQLPFTAKEHGAFIIEANIEETDFSRLITNAFLKGRAGTTLPELARAVQSRLQNTAL